MAAEKGPLQTKVELRRLPLLADKEQQLAVIQGWMAEDDKKLLLLCDELGVKDGPLRFYDLALALARKHCIGFQERAPLGKWTLMTRGFLFVEIERLTKSKPKNPGHTVSWAADVLARRPEWTHFLGRNAADGGEALRVQYQSFKGDPWAKIFRKAFKWHEHEKTLAEWDAEVRDALRDPHGLKTSL